MSTEMRKPVVTSEFESELNNWIDHKMQAVELINSIGSLLYNKSVELVLFRHTLVDESVSEVLKLHNTTQNFTNSKVSIYETNELAKELLKLDLAPSKIDIGKLASEWLAEEENFATKSDFIANKLEGMIGQEKSQLEPRDVILYGFGRIGRIAARELIKQAGKGQQLRLRAIVTRGDNEAALEKRAALLRNDSVHGAFQGIVEVDTAERTMTVNGQVIQMINGNNPDEIDYTAYGINNALVIDNTGVFKDRTALSRHLKSKGVERVILTAPGKEIPNIVYGVNQGETDIEKENIYSAASCTTNAIVPVLKVIEDKFKIEKGHIETVHAYTNDQNLLDNMHKSTRRGRSAAINMVITETGAGKAVTKVLPQLQDKLTANAVRVPTPNGSLAIMNLSLKTETSFEEVNEVMRNAALEGSLVNQIYYSVDPELVSSDIVGNSCCSVFDSPATIVSPDKKNVVLYVWYDNEFGYTKQVIRLAKHVSKVRRLIYY
ncbi:glyceraldehyde-3-phosphate dehydrogenase [Acidiluteibacter ferrifornacis]|nr:glyceraldehyde-3-phosphate dehydrogenase [Acidiluteibacter ferrifornacis]